MAKITYYWFTFEDGYSVCARGFSKNEMAHHTAEHGKLINKTIAS